MTEFPDSRFGLIDSMRGRWERKIGTSVDALQAYVEGFSDAKGLAPDDTWEKVSRWVHAYLEMEPEVQWHWTEQIARAASSYSSQIPLLYGAIDKGLERRCRERWIWLASEQWRSGFDLRQRDFHRLRPDMISIAPHSLAIELSDEGIWRLHQLNSRALRMSEKSGDTLRELKQWARNNRFLLVPEDAWVLDFRE